MEFAVGKIHRDHRMISKRPIDRFLGCLMAWLLCHGHLFAADLRWEKLAPIPDPPGFAGSFAGVSGGALLVAGGANFPDQKPWAGGAKVWYSEVFVLEKPEGAWRGAGRLPTPLGYGVVVSHKRGLICIGGSDARQHHASTLVLRWVKGRLEIEPLLGLPEFCANLSGALISDTVYVAGGCSPWRAGMMDRFTCSAARP